MSAGYGSFVWHDLMTEDFAGAKSFYTEVIGWKTTKWPGGDYELWAVGDTQIGGLMTLPEEAKKAGAPPHWLGYVGVHDVAASAQKAQTLGGKILVPATEIPDVGAFAIVSDPQGAVFAVFQSVKPSTKPDTQGVGQMSWAELNTTDYKSAWKFYSDLFGWKPTRSMDMGDMGQYFMFGTDTENSIGGMSDAAKMMNAPAHWMFYVNVKNADDAAKAIVSKGGKILNGPMDVPGGDRIAQCMDPQGAAFGIFSPKK